MYSTDFFQLLFCFLHYAVSFVKADAVFLHNRAALVGKRCGIAVLIYSAVP